MPSPSRYHTSRRDFERRRRDRVRVDSIDLDYQEGETLRRALEFYLHDMDAVWEGIGAYREDTQPEGGFGFERERVLNILKKLEDDP